MLRPGPGGGKRVAEGAKWSFLLILSPAPQHRLKENMRKNHSDCLALAPTCSTFLVALGGYMAVSELQLTEIHSHPRTSLVCVSVP